MTQTLTDRVIMHLGMILWNAAPEPIKGNMFKIPIDGVTSTFAVLAKRRVGKTHNSSVLAEEMLEAGQQVAIIDPTDAWWGLRSSADGRGPGYAVIVLGGPHQDIPLEPTAGAVIAEFVMESGKSVIICTKGWTKGEEARFVEAFANRLLLKNKAPLHLFIDEADCFAPQKPFPEQMRMLGAIDGLVRRGGIQGVGVTLITQRSAVINKDVLSQIEVLVVMRTLFKGDKDAIRGWTHENGDPDHEKIMMESLPTLKIGEAWIWSPGWLECFVRIQFRRRRTFDSSATPKIGEIRREPAVRAPIDLGALTAAIVATIEEAKANDPKALKAKIAELEKQIQKGGSADHSACDRIQRETEQRLVKRVNEEVDARNTLRGRLEVALKLVRDAAGAVGLLGDDLPGASVHSSAALVAAGSIIRKATISVGNIDHDHSPEMAAAVKAGAQKYADKVDRDLEREFDASIYDTDDEPIPGEASEGRASTVERIVLAAALRPRHALTRSELAIAAEIGRASCRERV